MEIVLAEEEAPPGGLDEDEDESEEVETTKADRRGAYEEHKMES